MRKYLPNGTMQLLILFNSLLALVAFVKDIVFASYFGTSNIADAISLAFFIPDTIGNNLVGAAIAVSIIPVFTKLSIKSDLSSYYDAIQKVAALLVFGTSLLILCLLFLAKPLFQSFIENDDYLSIVVLYFFFLVPIVCISPFWLIGSSLLQVSRRFIVPAITPIFLNCILLVCLLWCGWIGLPQETGGKIFSCVMTLATLSVSLITWHFVLKQHKIKNTLHSLHLKNDCSEVKEIYPVFWAYFLTLFFSQTALFVERIFASSLGEGTVAALTYAYRISQFPLWVFIAAINTFILPMISTHLEKNDFNTLKNDLVKSFVFVFGISGVISIIFVTYSEQLLKMILLRDSFTIESLKLTSSIFKGYGLAVVGQSLYVFCTRYYVAKGRMRAPLLTGLAGSFLNITLLFFLVPWQGAMGIGYAVAISSSLSGLLLLCHFIKDVFYLEQKGGLPVE